MDQSSQNTSSASSASTTNARPNAPSHANFNAAAVGPGQYVSTNGGTAPPSNARTTAPAPTNAQIARSGGIGLATTVGANKAVQLQQQHGNPSQHVPPKTANGGPTQQSAYSAAAGSAPPTQPQRPPPATNMSPSVAAANRNNANWSAVPNPLMRGAQPGRPLHQNSAHSYPPQYAQGRPSTVPSARPMPQQLPQQARAPYPHSSSMPKQQQQQQKPPPMSKPKVVLSEEAKNALAKAIWSAIRSPDGSIAPNLMQAALSTGLPRHAIENAARVARERESMKRGNPPSSKVQHPRPVPMGAYNNSAPPPIQYGKPKMPVSRAPYTTKPNVMMPQQRSHVPSMPKPKPAPTAMQLQAARMIQLRAEERAKWRRVHQGVFTVQKGKFLSPPHTVTSIIRTQNVMPVLPPFISNPVAANTRKRPRLEVLQEAMEIQQRLRRNMLKATPLLEPEKYKRVKMEAKKFAKALDRVARKTRQNAAEALNKQHKELSKAIASHQQEFFKFHKQRKTEALRLAKTIRDNSDKESKKREKDMVAAEKARLAALKANDMDAYSKLLEETKNERLKFLMDKTESHFSQISTSLLQSRNQDKNVSSTGGTASYYASAHLKTEEVRQPSILIGGDLKEYQLSGLQWMVSLYNNKLNGILADEMGLGKTIQAISLIAYLMEFKGNLGPYLVIVPLSTLSNWTNEFAKWCPSAHLICYKGTPAQRKELYKEQVRNGHFNILLTTYEYIIKDKASLRKITWQYAIVDEGHRMKNAASKFAKTLSTQYETRYRLLLTGTPLMNDLSELWALLNFLLPAIFNSVDTFDQWFNKPFSQFGSDKDANTEEANLLSNEERMFIIHRLHELLRPFMLRRVKSEVLDQLPEKVEKILRCELSSWQKELYKQISKKAVAENSSFVEETNARGLNNVVMQLRKVCNHPYLFSPEGYHINENIIRSSAKFELLDRMLPKLRAAGHRVLMFTQMTAVMTILEDYFAYRGFMSLRLDGSTPAEEREKRMYKFNAPDSPYFIFLLSTRAGGLGLNLTAANTVIIFDSDWNPMMDLQAQDRAHRIGQRSDVSVFRLVTHSPVEEKILSRATEKLNMSELVVEAGQFDKRSVENDNSLERKKMMEVLLTDFSANNTKPNDEKPPSEKTGSDVGDDDDDDDDDNGSDNGSEDDKEEDLNDLLSNNENDYRLYRAFDKQPPSDAFSVDTSLFLSEDDVPDWIKYPTKNKNNNALHSDPLAGDGPRKRKEVMYDDGLTEKQFMRMMDKQFDGENAAREQAKSVRSGASSNGAVANATGAAIASDLTDWTFRKLISCSKAVVALKDPSTKRRLSDIFLEKPSPEQFPDYYEMIEKPIAINDILRKCRGKLYTSVQEYREDWKLMVANAIQFNGEGSWVAEDGKALIKELERVLKKNGLNDEMVPAKPKTPLPKPKKKLRIKLSLKSIKASSKGDDGDQTLNDPSDETPSKGKRGKKRKKE
eukprot:scaffold7139_cov115-Cylindrotheca_fusiformis.AAC.12